MNQQAERVLRVFVLAIIATIILKLLGVAINIIVSVVIPLLVIYFLYKVLIKKKIYLDKGKKMKDKNQIIKIILGILGIILGFKILKIIFSIIFALLIPIFIGGGLILIPILLLIIPLGILSAIGYAIYKFFLKKNLCGKKIKKTRLFRKFDLV